MCRDSNGLEPTEKEVNTKVVNQRVNSESELESESESELEGAESDGVPESSNQEFI